MTAPFGGQQISAGSQPVVQTPGTDLQGYIALALEVMARTRQHKLTQAQEAVKQIKPGVPYAALTPDQQKAVRRATGRKDFRPDEVITPHSVETFLTDAGITSLGGGKPTMAAAPDATATALPGQNPGPPEDLASNLGLTFLAQRAGANPRSVTTRAALEAESRASEDKAQTGASVATLGRQAMDRLKQGAKPEDLSAPEMIGFQAVMGFVPSAPIAEQLSATARAKVMEAGIRFLQSPESSSIATLLRPYGVNVGDVIGAFSTGIGQTVIEAMQGANIERNKNASIADVVARATANIAEDVGKKVKFASAAEIIAVMNGDPRIINTPKGKAIAQFMAAGFDASMAEAALKGDPSGIAVERAIEIMRIPQIAGNEKALSQVLNMVRGQIADVFTRSQLGPRPQAPGQDQQRWDGVWSKLLQQMGGVFGTYSIGPLMGRIDIPQPGPGGSAAGTVGAQGISDIDQMGDFLIRIGALGAPDSGAVDSTQAAAAAGQSVQGQPSAQRPQGFNFSTVPDPRQFTDPALKEAAQVYAHALQNSIFTPAEREGARRRFEEEYNRVYNPTRKP